MFGVATIVSGGMALFGGTQAREAVGNAVPFVLWFNFLAGFAYIVIGLGLLNKMAWAAWFAVALAAMTALVAVVFTFHVVGGGAFEMRTVGALGVRFLFWLIVAIVSLNVNCLRLR